MPNRIIKESICTSETIDQMSWFEECFYHRLWTACDDYGRMDARPAILKSKLFPLKDRLSLKDIENALYKLADIGCVRLYECDSKPYLYLPAWEVHQRVRNKRSKYPEPDSSADSAQSSDIRCQLTASCGLNPIQSESESESESNTPHTPSRGKRAASLPKYQPEWFERFWTLYPRKTNRAQAVKAWDKLKPDLELCNVMADAIRSQMQSRQWQDPDHIPHPSTWLNGARWTDELPGGEKKTGFYDPSDWKEWSI